jgi:hypothetical protein
LTEFYIYVSWTSFYGNSIIGGRKQKGEQMDGTSNERKETEDMEKMKNEKPNKYKRFSEIRLAKSEKSHAATLAACSGA